MDVSEAYAIGADGTRVWWSSAGSGGPAIVLTDGIGCAGYVWRHLAPALARGRRVIHWNYRGHGRSESPRDPARVTLDDAVDDLVAVLDAAGEPRAVLAGHSVGVQVALELHRRAPSRVQALVLLCGAPGRPLDTFHDSPALRTAFPYARAAVLRWPEAARAAFRAVVPTELALRFALAFEVDRTRVREEDLVPYFRDLAEVDPAMFVRMLGSVADHDTSDHLPHVDVPTLVVAGERDSFTPMRLSERMHEGIAGSELVVVRGGTHVAPLEAPELLARRIGAFLDRHAPVEKRRPRRAASPGRAVAPAGKGRPAPKRAAAPRRRVARRPARRT